jgi:biotin operon repressor
MENKDKYYVVSVEDTIKYGIISAAIIGRVRWWCEYNEKNKVKDRFHIEHWWSGFLSSKQLSEQLGIPIRTVEKHLFKLLKDGIIIKDVFNKKGYDRTSWYRVNPSTPIEYAIYANSVNGYTPIGEMDIRQLGKPIPDNLSIIKNVSHSGNNTSNIEISVEEQLEQINFLIEEDNFTTGEERGKAYKEQFKLIELLKEISI